MVNVVVVGLYAVDTVDIAVVVVAVVAAVVAAAFRTYSVHLFAKNTE